MNKNTDMIKPDSADLPRNGESRSMVLSSNSTIVWRVFLPVFVSMFLLAFVVLFWFGIDPDDYGTTTSLWWSRGISLVALLVWSWLLYRYIWPLKRVEANDAYVFVSDYWNTVRYLWADVQQIEDKKLLGMPYVRLYLRSSGRFGAIIHFLPARHYWEWMKAQKGFSGF